MFLLKTAGGTAISNEAGLVFELRDAKKKEEGKARISIQEFFKGRHNFDREVNLKIFDVCNVRRLQRNSKNYTNISEDYPKRTFFVKANSGLLWS